VSKTNKNSETETMTTSGLQETLNLVADELMFIFFPEEYTKNDDEWTVGEGSRLSYLSSYGGSLYTQETISTESSKGTMSLIAEMIVNDEAKKLVEKSEEREEDLEPVPESDEDIDTREAEASSKSEPEEESESEDESEMISVEDSVLNVFLSESDDADGLQKHGKPTIGEKSNTEIKPETADEEEKSEERQSEAVLQPDVVQDTKHEVIDLCDAEEVIHLSGHETIVSDLGESKNARRLQRLRETRQKLRSEREKWEAEFGNDDTMQRHIKEIRGNRNGREGRNVQSQEQEIRRKLTALSRTLSGESGPTRIMHSEEAIIEYHGKQIQEKIQSLSKILDDIMIKKLNGEFPDDAETREMEAIIRANILEFQKWWHSSKPVHNVRPAPAPEMRSVVW
jgi:hypothetical protein